MYVSLFDFLDSKKFSSIVDDLEVLETISNKLMHEVLTILMLSSHGTRLEVHRISWSF